MERRCFARAAVRGGAAPRRAADTRERAERRFEQHSRRREDHPPRRRRRPPPGRRRRGLRGSGSPSPCADLRLLAAHRLDGRQSRGTGRRDRRRRPAPSLAERVRRCSARKSRRPSQRRRAVDDISRAANLASRSSRPASTIFCNGSAMARSGARRSALQPQAAPAEQRKVKPSETVAPSTVSEAPVSAGRAAASLRPPSRSSNGATRRVSSGRWMLDGTFRRRLPRIHRAGPSELDGGNRPHWSVDRSQAEADPDNQSIGALVSSRETWSGPPSAAGGRTSDRLPGRASGLPGVPSATAASAIAVSASAWTRPASTSLGTRPPAVRLAERAAPATPTTPRVRRRKTSAAA